jgi:hypothetical protein
MTEQERTRRSYDFFSTLPPQLQNQLSMQHRLESEHKSPQGTQIIDRYYFSKWYE